jgi:hypothetical protein
MKNTAWKALAVLAFGCLSASAQSSQGVVTKVPFAFTAGTKRFPAGEYRIARYQPYVVSIKSLDGKTSGFVLCQRTESVQAQAKSIVVFHRYDDQFFLNKIWEQGGTSGLEFPKTAKESEAQAKSLHVPETVTASIKNR